MKIDDLFRKLSYGELSNLAISNSGSGDSVEAKWPQLIDYTNDGLMLLHSRFILSEKELVLEQVAAQTKYNLTSKYAVFGGAGSGVTDHYLIDTADEPFLDDLIKVLVVRNADDEKLALNDQEDPDSLFTPSALVLQIQVPVALEQLTLFYQAKHPVLLDEITADVPNVLDQDIEIPNYLKNALQQWVAHKVYSHMNGQENVHKSQEYLTAYEVACRGVEQGDLAHQTFHTSHTKLEDRGFA